MPRWTGQASIKGKNEAMRMAALSFSLIGLQFVWGIEMTYCTPMLLQLGLSKSRTALVWIAGPLSGLIMQPLVGVIADKSTSRFGRRRPFMVFGSVLTGACLLLMGWVSEVVGLFLAEGNTKQNITILVAVLAIYVADFAINAVQSCCRSLIVDSLPISQQQTGSAWAARMSAGGHVVGYFIGTLNLAAIFPSQFKGMTVISTLGLWGAVGLTSWAVTERIRLPSEDEKQSAFSVLPELWRRTLNLPPRIQAICWTQFWTWIGWFFFLFYSSTWVGETYFRYQVPTDSAPAEDHDTLGTIGRLGSLALVIFSIVTLASSILLPYLIRSPEDPDLPSSKFTPRPPPSLAKSSLKFLLKIADHQPDLATAWMISSLVFATVTAFAPWVRSVHAATLVVAGCGIPWAVSCWAPFGLIGEEINKLSDSGLHAHVHGSAVPGYTAVRGSYEEDEEEDVEMSSSQMSEAVMSNRGARSNHPDDGDGQSSTGELAGVYLGVLNVYTTLPQLVGTLISYVVFSILEPAKNDASTPIEDAPDHHRWLDGKKNVNSIAVCLFLGGAFALGAAESARRLRKIL